MSLKSFQNWDSVNEFFSNSDKIDSTELDFFENEFKDIKKFYSKDFKRIDFTINKGRGKMYLKFTKEYNNEYLILNIDITKIYDDKFHVIIKWIGSFMSLSKFKLHDSIELVNAENLITDVDKLASNFSIIK